jgi:hypothetical protein
VDKGEPRTPKKKIKYGRDVEMREAKKNEKLN